MMQKVNKNYTLLEACIFGLLLIIKGGMGCSNSALSCTSTNKEVTCNILSANTSEINEQITICVRANHDTLILRYASGGMGAQVNLNIPENIVNLQIYNNFTTGYVETSMIHSKIAKIFFLKKEIHIMHRDFFAYFPNLISINADILGGDMMPFFGQNKHLTSIEVKESIIAGEATRVIDHTMIGGLNSLLIFKWQNGSVSNITQDAFIGTEKLEEIDLTGNMINQLYNCTFGKLGSLKRISLIDNKVSIVESHTFVGLHNLENLILDDNPEFPLSTITPIKNLQVLSLREYTSKDVLPEILEQLTNLKSINLTGISFKCGCGDQWLSKVESFGIIIDADYPGCNGGVNKVKELRTYRKCPKNNFHCFNKSIICPGDSWYRTDTEEGCNCTYPMELFLNELVCSDIDECQDSSICQGNCSNTLGSYTCDCDIGFYNVNDTYCEDINECASNNGNCDHNCTNKLGSHECYCLPGYKKEGLKECKDVDECASTNGNCDHNCTNNIGSYECYCLPGYKKEAVAGSCTLIVDSCKINNGGCHHNCVQSDTGYECSCSEGFKESSLNTSHCELNGSGTISEQIFNANKPQFYLLLMFALVFLITTVVLFVILFVAILYFRRQLQLANSFPASTVLTLTQLDKVQTKESTIIKSPLSESKEMECKDAEVVKERKAEEANKS